jgi:hypothetical protein
MIDFNKIEDILNSGHNLSISEEMLGAYIEGKTSNTDNSMIESSLINDAELASLLTEVSDFPYDDNSNDFLDVSVIENPNEEIITNEFNNCFNMTYSDSETQRSDRLGAAAAHRIFGEDGNGSGPNPDALIFQGNEGVCAIRSQQIILRDYGIDIPLEDLKQYAIQQGWYDPSGDGGTPMCYIGALMEQCGVNVKQSIDCTVYDLINELSQGHRVIVGVDADELWADRDNSLIEKTTTWLKDVFQGESANHALVVAGVDVNPNDPNDVKVILTDPGTGDLRIEYTLDEFMDAWEDSHCFMVSTTTPAPYQYDEVHECMVPSNFAVEQFIDTNSLPLTPDVRGVEYMAMESDYTPHYANGHLTTIGHKDDGTAVSYDNFSQEYAKYRSVVNVPGTFGHDHFDRGEFMTSLKNLFSTSSQSDNTNSQNGGNSGSGTEESAANSGSGSGTGHDQNRHNGHGDDHDEDSIEDSDEDTDDADFGE